MKKDAKITKKKEIMISGLFVVLLVLINYNIAHSTVNHYCNPGIAFGVVLPTYLFTVMWVATMSIVGYLYMTSHVNKKNNVKRLGLLMIITGGIANIIDRFLHNCVIDYITLVPWNSFNLADTSIFLGAMIVLWYQWSEPKSQSPDIDSE